MYDEDEDEDERDRESEWERENSKGREIREKKGRKRLRELGTERRKIIREMKRERKESRIDFISIGAIMTRHRTDQNKKVLKNQSETRSK